MDIPEFAKDTINRGRCRQCRCPLSEQFVEFVGLFDGTSKNKTYFGANLRCPRCEQVTRVLLRRPMGWADVAVQIIHAMAGRPPAAQRPGKGPPLTDKDVAAMRRRLAEAKDGAAFMRLFGVEAPRRPAGEDPSQT